MESFWIVIAAELIKSANEYSNAILGASDYANALAIVAMAQMAERRLLIWRTRV